MKLCRLGWIIVIPLLLGAEYFRWVDENGVTQFTQQPPPSGQDAMRIRMQSGIPENAVAPVAPEQEVDPGLTPQQQRMQDDLRRAEDARRGEIARIRQANCTRAYEVLERLSEPSRIRVRDGAGQERVMPESERQARIAEAQRGIVENCRAGADG
jgi:hypothetical protein